ncbi:MAG: aldo/keto reductase [Planctomycetes bacterium]|nr:aldo/keto reductase [Planctomycetota bacterium]
MQYRDFGRLGKKVSALGYGAMRLPQKEGHIAEDEAIQCIRRAFELGVNYIDTAHGYNRGESEIVVGKALKGWRDRVMLSTKNPCREPSGDAWRRIFDLSFRRLDAGRIDFLHFHFLRYDEFTNILSGPGRGLEMARKVQAEGLFKHLCFSSHDKPENIAKLINTGEFAAMTVQYNLLDRRNEDVIALAREKGLGVIIMGPVGGGRLVAPSEPLQRMLNRAVKSTPEAALRFVLSNPHVSVAISGMNSLQQVEENCATASDKSPLTASERERVQQLLSKNQELAKLYCTGCNYCMPCPNKVNIPENFRLMNLHRVWGLTAYAKAHYARLGAPNARPEGLKACDCKACGECEPKCPQKIPIVKQLEETAKALA